MKIDSYVYLVGSGQMGIDLTDAFDCNVYLFDAGESYILFDTGAGLGTQEIINVCKQDDIDVRKIKYIFLTHAHADHSGGLSSLLEHIEASVYASEQTADIVSNGDEVALSLDGAKKSGIYPIDYNYYPAKVDKLFSHGDQLVIGNLTIEVIHTPGHSDDHHSFLIRGLEKSYLLAGDAIFHGGKIVLQNTPDCNLPKTIASIKLLNTYDFDALLSGHMNYSLRNGKRHIETACRYIDAFASPPVLS